MSSLAPSVAIERWFMRLAFLLVAITTGGCPFIIPTPGLHPNAPTPEVMETIKPKVTTRTEVLMMLGDPDFRLEDDRYFVYDWTDLRAIVGLAGPYAVLAGSELKDLHALVIDFAPDGRVARVKEFEKSASGKGEKEEQDLWEDIRVWIKAANGTAR